MEPTDTTVERGSGNVFADLGFPDADAHLVKAGLVSRIDDIVYDRGLTQTEAARLGADGAVRFGWSPTFPLRSSRYRCASRNAP